MRTLLRKHAVARTSGVILLVLLSATLVAANRSNELPSPADLLAEYRRPESIPFPDDNAYTEARAELGKMLFFDPRLSGSGITSCATCHNPGLAWGDRLPLGVGARMKQLRRRTPTILNVAWAEALFWDGRADTLEEQALAPIQSQDEMDMELEDMVLTLAAISGYAPLFEEAYPGEGITPQTVAKAIATYERTVVSGQAPFDRWIGGEASAIPAEARRGFALFNGKARCSNCHASWRFSDDSFHDIGVEGKDKGRGEHFDFVPVLQHAFKTPTLRNVTLRAPYMHNGTEATLEEVIELYDVGGRVKRESLSSEIVPLHLSKQEKKDLVAFLKTLTSDDSPVTIPTLPR